MRSRQLIEQFGASPYFEIVAKRSIRGEVDDDLASGRRVAGGRDSAGLRDRALKAHGDPVTPADSDPADGTDSNSSGVALAYASGAHQRASTPRSSTERGERPGGDRRHASASGSTRSSRAGLHGAGRPRAAAARDHGQPLVDGDRARARARHARAVERDAARPLGADSRQAAAVRDRRLHRRAARRRRWPSLVRGAAPRQPVHAAALRASPTCSARSGWGCSSRRSPRRSSRR